MQVERVKYGRALARVERDMNRVIDAINGNRIASAPAYRVKRTSNGTTLDIALPKQEAPEVPETLEIKRCRIKHIFGQYLVCVETDETGFAEIGDDILVAKPRELRVDAPTAFNTRTITIFGGRTIQENIVPPYVQDQGTDQGELYALRMPDSKTNVIVNGTRLEWIDLNIEARHWNGGGGTGYTAISFQDAFNQPVTFVVFGQQQF